jgi:hypothetical protein
MEETSIETTNINSKWLQNISDNFIRIEKFETLGRNGFRDILEFISIPANIRDNEMALAQYQNMINMLNELIIVLPDIAPILGTDKTKQYQERLYKVREITKDRSKFLNQIRKINNKMIIETKPLLLDTIDYLHSIRADLYIDVSHILFPASATNREHKDVRLI